MSLTLLDAALRGMLLALLVLVAAVLWRDRRRSPAALAGVALALGQVVQTIGATPWVEATLPFLWQAPLIAVSVANVVLFWIFVRALFDDAFEPRPVHALAWGGVALLSLANCTLAVTQGAWALREVTVGLQRAVPLLFAVLAAQAAAQHWRADLVEQRRRLRLFIVVTGVSYTVAMLAARLASPSGRLPPLLALVDVSAMLAMIAVIAWQLLRLGPSELFPLAAPAVAAAEPEPAAPAGPDPAEERLAQALERTMAQERAYRDEGLSVSTLAARLAVPEYRLRRLINQRLGHRNFNAFVNGYRLAEASSALADPQRRELPVLSIALEAGFQSIGPFNRAFKAATGLTPTEFRREKLADS
ncbi:helix-turn-helix domain-containing protein [Variovorax sp. YR752]|uniref:helix-turn-helix domain-containing protein n=1 Tax=Variovorax sp. YR752 TaxID=1884383 RepID=UPI0031383634